MRILAISNLYPRPGHERIASFNRQQLRALAQEQQVRVVAPVAWLQWLNDVARMRVAPRHYQNADDIMVDHPTYYYPPRLLRARHGSFLLRSIRNTVEHVIERFKPDVVLGCFGYPDGWVAVRLAREAGLAVVIKVHGNDILVLGRDSARRPRLIEALQAADGVVAVSDDLAQRVIDLGVPQDKVHVVHNGVDGRLFTPDDRLEARAKLGLPHEQPIVLFVGNVLLSKGAGVLVETCRVLRGGGTTKTLTQPLPEGEEQRPSPGLSQSESSDAPSPSLSQRERSDAPSPSLSRRERSDAPSPDLSQRERSNAPSPGLSQGERSDGTPQRAFPTDGGTARSPFPTDPDPRPTPHGPRPTPLSPVTCYLVGSGRDEKKIRAMIARHGLEDCVKLVGPCAHGDLPDWYRACDLVALPSFSEGIPNVLREAMSCGRPFVATNVGGIPEIAHPSFSRLVPPGDAAALAEAIEAMLAERPVVDDEIVRSLSISWEESAARLADVLAAAVAEKRGRQKNVGQKDVVQNAVAPALVASQRI